MMKFLKQHAHAIRRGAILAVAGLMLLPALALAAGTTLVPVPQIWVFVLGALTPLVTYVLNHFAPWVTEPVKAAVLAVVASGIAVLYTAIETGVAGFNSATLQLVVTALIAAFGSHYIVWKPSEVSVKLGGGSNAPKPTV